MCLVETPSFTVGRFRCPAGDARWTEVNWIGDRHVLAFPRRAVTIERSRHRRVVANPNHVVLYDPDETYRRELIASEGDDSLFIELRAGAAAELLPPRPSGAPSFRGIESMVPERLAVALHALELRLVARGSGVDSVAVDELLARVVDAIVCESLGVAEPTRPTPGELERRRLVQQTRAFLSVAYAERLTLADIGRHVGASPFHLARAFRAATGSTLHRYREQLRLRDALHRLREGEEDLAGMAVDLGFASHSHFDDRFRLAFGSSPSDLRRPRRSGIAHDLGSRRPRPHLAS
jgi:AraC-like DNA-binding protein